MNERDIRDLQTRCCMERSHAGMDTKHGYMTKEEGLKTISSLYAELPDLGVDSSFCKNISASIYKFLKNADERAEFQKQLSDFLPELETCEYRVFITRLSNII